MEAKTEIFREPDGGIRVQMRLDAEYIRYVSDAVPKLVVEELTHKIVEHFIAEKKQEIIAKIPLEAVLNGVVAETIRKIGAA
jgi:hypothetical protein